jgi:hypothetical protein
MNTSEIRNINWNLTFLKNSNLFLKINNIIIQNIINFQIKLI